MANGALEDVVGSAEEETLAGQTYESQDEIREKAKMQPSTAISRLEQARQRLIESRAPNLRAKHFRAAEAFLSPTRTGQFGEQIGKVAGALGAYEESEQARLGGIDKQLLQTEVALERQQATMRPRLGTSRTVYHPDDSDLPYKDRRIINMQPIIYPDGHIENEFSGEEGEEIEVASMVNPETVRATKEAAEEGKGLGEIKMSDALAGIEAMKIIPKLQTARSILEEVKTSGIKRGAARMVKLLGLPGSFADTTDLTVLQKQLGQFILAELSKLTGPKSDFEYARIEEMMPSIGGDTEANKIIVDEMIASYMEVLNDHLIHDGQVAGSPRFVR